MSEEIEQLEQKESHSDVDVKPAKKSSSKDLDFGGLEFFYEKNKKAIT